jgi:hypothetical protein
MKKRGQKKRQQRLKIENLAKNIHRKEGIPMSEAKKIYQDKLEKVEKHKLPSNPEILTLKTGHTDMTKVRNPFRKGYINKEQARELKSLRINVHRNMTEKEALKLLKSR